MKFSLKKILLICSLLLIVVFWLEVIFQLGVLRASFVPRNGFFSYTFNWWDSTNTSEHYFLGIQKAENIQHQEVYVSSTYQVLLINYLVLSMINWILGVSFEVSQNFIVYFYVFLFLSVVFYLKKEEIKSMFYKRSVFAIIWLFLIIGLLVTNALPWVSFLRFNADNTFFVTAIVFCYLSVYYKVENLVKRDRVFLFSGIIIVSISPIYVLPWILGYISSQNELKIRYKMVVNMLIVGAYSFINMFLPVFFQKQAGYKSISSGFMFRSGLDGLSNHFTSSYATLIKPVSEQHLGNIVSLIVVLIVLNFLNKERQRDRYKQLFFMLFPFFFSIIIFPQSVTIHMYLHEFFIVIPLFFSIVITMFSFKIDEMTPNKYILISLAMLFVIMGQLIEISKAFADW